MTNQQVVLSVFIQIKILLVHFCLVQAKLLNFR